MDDLKLIAQKLSGRIEQVLARMRPQDRAAFLLALVKVVELHEQAGERKH